MIASLDITTEHRKALLALLRRFVPGVEVWAYGSRVKWKSHPASDLDLVVFTAPEERRQFSDLKDALAEANLPFMVGVHVWAEEPERFQEIIRKAHIILQQAEDKKKYEVLGWRKMMLGELTINFDGKRLPVKESERKPGLYPYYGASGIVDHVDKYIFDGDYLLIAEDGENLRTQKTPIAFLARGKFWVNNHAHIVTGNSQAETRFLMYALNNANISGYLTGSTMPKLTQGNMNRIQILAPSLSEQRAISAVLGSLDDKIELNRRMNETLDALAQSLFKSWFVDATQSTLPKGWREVPFTETVEIIGGGTPKTSVAEYWGGDIPWFSVVDSPHGSDLFVIDSEKKITQAGIENSSTRVLPVGTTIITARGTVGKIALVGVPMAMNQSCYGLRGKADKKGFHTYFVTRALVSQLQQHAHGSVFDTITRDTLAGMQVALPPAAVVEQFEEKVSPLMERIRNNLHESRTLAALRDALLPKLLSGELRVTNTKPVKVTDVASCLTK
jgi:type I restriction enzyme, S subunit